MRLARLDIADYRSLFLDNTGSSFEMTLGKGANTIVGPNNCGKSNVFSAIALALDPNHPFSANDDLPEPRRFAHAVIMLDFVADPTRLADRPVLESFETYERSTGAANTYAEHGHIRIRVSFPPSPDGGHIRRQDILTPSQQVANTDTQHQLAERALGELGRAVRFVLIRSGESLESVLEGNFREILHSVIRERLHDDFAQAEQSREDYIDGLRGDLLAPLSAQLNKDVASLFPDITNVRLSPDVSSIETTLSNVDVSLTDLVDTPLSGKGTGVRAGLLVAMLRYLSTNATKAMVFAIEEPEAFLHPGAQEDLRDHLDDVALSDDVSLLVTTHSPFIVTQSPDGRVFALEKDSEGRTRIAGSAAGDEPHAPLLGSLYRDVTFEEVLRAAARLAPDAEALIFVEGEGDLKSMQIAVAAVRREDLLNGLQIQPAGGASKIIVQAVVAKAATDKPILVITDNDQPGKSAVEMLKKLGFGSATKAYDRGTTSHETAMTLTYAVAFERDKRNFPYEAEDLFDPSVIESFVERHGHAIVDGSQKRPDAAFHYDLGNSAKELLERHLHETAGPSEVRRWIELIYGIRRLFNLEVPEESPAELIDAALNSQVSTVGGGDVLVINGEYDRTRYLDRGAVILDTTSAMPDNITHIAFYSGGAIQPEVPAKLADYPSLLFVPETVEQLRGTGAPSDSTAADVIDASLSAGDGLVDETHRVVILAPVDDRSTLVLENAVENTKQKKGRRVAWTISPKVVEFSALAAMPQTTDEIDAFTSQERNSE